MYNFRQIVHLGLKAWVLLAFSLQCDYSNRGIWKKIIQDHTLYENKDSQVLCKRANNIDEFEGCFVRGQVSSNAFKVFNGCRVERWILLVRFQKISRILCFQKLLWLDNLLPSAPVRVVALWKFGFVYCFSSRSWNEHSLWRKRSNQWF